MVNEVARGASTSLADRVYGQLLDDISSGRWAPDGTVSAYSLAARLSVSRTPVVEALKRLETDGLVEIVPRVGARLTRSTPDTRGELFAIVGVLLGLATERAAQRVDNAWLDRLEARLEELAAAAERDDRPRYRELAAEIYDSLITAGLPAHALPVKRLWRLLRASARRDRSPAIRPDGVAVVRLILEALRARSPLRARALVERQVAAVAANMNGPASGPASAPAAISLEHEALLYGSRSEFLASAVPFAVTGLQRGESVLVVSQPENLEALGSSLGADASRLDLRDSAQWYDDPVSTLRRYREYIDRHTTASRVRIIGEPVWAEKDQTEIEDWLRYEAVINVALEAAPASIMCPYQADALSPRILSGAGATHPHLCQTAQSIPSPEYQGFFATASPST